MSQPALPVLDGPTRRLCGDIAERRLTRPRLAILAPGGYGKTAVLDHLDRTCARAGLPVHRFRPGAEPPQEGLVLVDDAHELGEPALDQLARLAAAGGGLVLAARPWPRPDTLAGVLRGLAGQLVLRPLDHAGTATLLAAATGRPAPDRLIEFTRIQTGGIPGFVHRLGQALGRDPEPRVPEVALAGFRHELDRAGEDTLHLLLAAETGTRLDAALLAGLLDRDRVAEVMDAARATGLLDLDGRLLPIGARALAALVPPERRAALWQRLAGLLLDRGAPVLHLARSLLEAGSGAGLGAPGTAAVFEAAAAEAVGTDPVLATRLLDAAVAAGARRDEVAARRAEAAARAGELDAALRLADEVIATAGAPERAAAARVAGTVLAYRGRLDRATRMHRWAGGTLDTAFAAIGLLGTGRQGEARESLAAPPADEPPTLLATAITDTAEGLLASVSEAPAAALSTLVSAAEMLEPVGRTVLLPDSPAALGALVAIHSGELTIADALLQDATAGGCGGDTLAARHRLLRAWVAMLRGEAERAGTLLAEAGSGLAPRDWLFAVALRVGLARRASDVAGLHRIWEQACTAVIRHPVDLFTLLPFGEFAVAAARLGDTERLAPHLRRASELCTALGDPPLWTWPLHWGGLHGAIIAERKEEAAAHAEALAAGAGNGPYATVLAAAARCWLAVVRGEVDPERVEQAARGLHEAGFRWDGARLAGQAAIRTADRKAMVGLLEVARSMQGQPAQPDEPAAPTERGRLSERELQVAELVVAGLTYKQVGDRLFISAKTVEHHMARMRQRLGAASRGELLSRLRSALEDRTGRP
ncbi:helix-turn-helix transcriptional regulator [Amycolatopsis cihanbeyliensis]|uniref:Regulatory LuxR family protein n=1 Tax=Amycolatopsis cihanbeyliensis TaxID=1128664 RepID=A0A542DML0_AMYCI|nr:helix-turn-helix transcriptional regulator [Amycolatopsis cihanbeyliensis]TQJ04330.1 regulatory LuxR family protein [Amycolatopsis cihanbeyliensis]